MYKLWFLLWTDSASCFPLFFNSLLAIIFSIRKQELLWPYLTQMFPPCRSERIQFVFLTFPHIYDVQVIKILSLDVFRNHFSVK